VNFKTIVKQRKWLGAKWGGFESLAGEWALKIVRTPERKINLWCKMVDI